MNNLAQRVMTAVVLIAGLLLLLFKASSFTFAAVLYVFGLLAVWELWRLVQLNNKAALWVMGLVYSACAVQLWVTQAMFVLLAMGALHAVVTTYVLKKKPALANLSVGVYGAVLLAVVVYAVTVLQGFGSWVLITALIVVWAADIGGYFFGKAIGGKFVQRGLAPSISPKKSWEGAIGGAVLAVVVTVVSALSTDVNASFQVWVVKSATVAESFSSHASFSNLLLVIAMPTLLIAAYSVTGDLVESLLKRQAGVKDSSQLLPGHGGVLDRIDALIPVLPLCAAWAYFVGYR
jgi:phosphatidate cytidylyltransferase